MKLQIEIDTEELRRWAGRHAEAGHAGIAQVLFAAADRYDSGDVAAELIAAERRRQIEVKGFTLEHDLKHGPELLRRAAFAYLAVDESGRIPPDEHGLPAAWPWSPESWKPSRDLVRNHVKAGALLAAAIDVLRATARAADPDVGAGS